MLVFNYTCNYVANIFSSTDDRKQQYIIWLNNCKNKINVMIQNTNYCINTIQNSTIDTSFDYIINNANQLKKTLIENLGNLKNLQNINSQYVNDIQNNISLFWFGLSIHEYCNEINNVIENVNNVIIFWNCKLRKFAFDENHRYIGYVFHNIKEMLITKQNFLIL